MLLLVSGATRTVRRLAGHPHLGVLLVPRDGNLVPPIGVPWAADNGAFGQFDEVAFRRLLRRIAGRRDCRFVAVPDVVADGAATLSLFSSWAPIVREHNLPAALVIQDGITMTTVPWAAVDAVFVGGSTGYKVGPCAAAITQEAKRRRLWVHMGRVNSLQRTRYARRIGCDSVDGSQYSRFSETYVPWALRFMADEERQRSFQWSSGRLEAGQ